MGFLVGVIWGFACTSFVIDHGEKNGWSGTKICVLGIASSVVGSLVLYFLMELAKP
jgi:hypothetical protein